MKVLFQLLKYIFIYDILIVDVKYFTRYPSSHIAKATLEFSAKRALADFLFTKYYKKQIMNDNLKSKKILTYNEVRVTKAGNSDEPLVNVKKYNPDITISVDDKEIIYASDQIYVRDEVAKKLARINDKLVDGMRLKIACGFRHPETQKQLFEKEKAEIIRNNPGISDERANELTHVLIAVPDVAGHIVGGAVDITIVDKNGNELDMGTAIADFEKAYKIATYASGLNEEQRKNRDLLHDLMTSENFAPFYGEWWHFSYGDREWAAFYGKDTAIYGECI